LDEQTETEIVGEEESMNRRIVIRLLATVLLATVCLADAQQPTKVARVGYLASLHPGPSPRSETFRQGLQELGYVEGKNIIIEYRYVKGKSDRPPALAAELVRLKVDVIVVEGATAARAVKEATSTIPIVMAAVGDPVGIGLIASIARPGGNVTGLTNLAPDLSGKRLELLKEVVPGLTRVAVLWYSTNITAAAQLKETEVGARSLGVQLQPLEIRDLNELEKALGAASKGRVGALMTLADALIFSNRTRILDFTAKNRLPAIFPWRELAEEGGLMAYAPNLPDLYRRAAYFVDRILKGAKPADLPVEQPTKFELVINLKTAKALGVKIPAHLLMEADKVIE
jgi:putative ABC transport system substrate-binding protein